MPKQKKQPKNACYFFMKERKEQLEAAGHRFRGGIKDVFHSCGPEWTSLTKADKVKYEEMAKEQKEEGKHDLHNKFTVSGESYAQVNEREQREADRISKLENLLRKLTHSNQDGKRPEDRTYIIIKCLHCIEQITTDGKVYLPAEISLAAFSLSIGLKSMYWTLIDPMDIPLGYAHDAKDSSEEYGIPAPGKYDEKYSDYKKITDETIQFIQHHLQDYDEGDLAVFCLPGEIEPARQSLYWLVQRLEDLKVDTDEHKEFLAQLNFGDLSKLMVNMAEYGKQINPSYRSQLQELKLEATACTILKIGSYDYRSEITCIHHRQGEASQKMNWCCRNVVMRRMFLMFKEFLPQYKIEMGKRHDIECLPKPPPQTRR